MKLIVALIVVLGCGSASATSNPQVAPRILRELIEQLGSRDYREREKASRQLVEMGRFGLPALRNARAHTDPEIRQRAMLLISQIEGRDSHRQILRGLLTQLLTDTRLSRSQCVEAIPLVCLGRSPAESERGELLRKLDLARGDVASREKFFDSLLYHPAFCKDIARVCQHINKIRTETQSAFQRRGASGTMMLINSKEVQDKVLAAGKIIVETKALRSNEDRMNVMFLLTLYRFPTEKEKSSVLKWFAKPKPRKVGWGDIQWALINTKEFVEEQRRITQGK